MSSTETADDRKTAVLAAITEGKFNGTLGRRYAKSLANEIVDVYDEYTYNRAIDRVADAARVSLEAFAGRHIYKRQDALDLYCSDVYDRESDTFMFTSNPIQDIAVNALIAIFVNHHDMHEESNLSTVELIASMLVAGAGVRNALRSGLFWSDSDGNQPAITKE
jgi:hypothetical protein